MNERSARIEEKLECGEVLLLDGATGTQLLAHGVQTNLPLWSASALWEAPDVVRKIHADYISAGADVITTNTFRTNVRVLKQAAVSYTCRELTKVACELAQEAREQCGRAEVAIGGCIAPVEDCYAPERVPSKMELEDEHGQLAEALKEGGVDFIFCETMNTSREAFAALTAAHATGLPSAISFVGSGNGELFDGECYRDVIPEIEQYDPLFIAVNCMQPDFGERCLASLCRAASSPIGIYANGAGCKDGGSGWILEGEGTPSEQYAEYARTWLGQGALVVGGCCGTGPKYIAQIRELLNEWEPVSVPLETTEQTA